MSEGFTALGIDPSLVDAASRAGLDEPSAIQRNAIPVLRRGGNAVLTASSGSGVTTGVLLALLDRLVVSGSPAGTEADAGPGAATPGAPERPRALVLTATEERAAAIARTAARLAGSNRIAIRAWSPEWNTMPSPVMLVAPVTTAARAIRESALKLDGLEALIIDSIDVLFALVGASVFEPIAASIPSAAQRVVTLATRTPDIDRFLESHVRRAIVIPARPADRKATAPVDSIGGLSYLVVARMHKPTALARLLRRPREQVPHVAVRSSTRAVEVRDDLRLRGWRVDAPDEQVVVATAAEAGQPIIAYDVPFDAQTLAAMDLAHGIVMVEAKELTHLRSIAAEAGIGLTAVGGTRAVRGSIAAFRARVRKAIDEQDLGAQLTLLGPLLDEYAPEEVAAALSALLRKRMEENAAAAAPRDEPQAAAAPAAPAFVRLYISMGQRDNIRPGDIVGAITGEAGIAGDRVGKIDIRDNFSVVEITAGDADKVIRALNGTTIKGRSVRVDYDRPQVGPNTGASARPRRSSRPSDSPRRGR